MKSKIDFRLIFITNSKLNPDLYRVVKKACGAGVKAVQIREKELSAKELLKLAKRLRILAKKTNTELFINDRYDIALLSNADGLHLPENGILPSHINRNKRIIMGRSVHSLMAAREAEKNGFDYILFGPVFRTPAKIKFGSPQGLSKLEKVCNSVNIPVFAVGGINPQRAKKCVESGAHGIAVIRELMLSPNISKTLRDFKEAIGSL
ncbi:MAG TPA: thiamine phosphate synthase [Ignavibacteria bacterium]|jgi:thiamine-phosphate pyrophosphorylase